MKLERRPAARRSISRKGNSGAHRPITLLTDFGLEDVYVGVMKGVIAAIAPGVQVIDITHGVDPHDVLQGGRRWAAAVPFFPPGSIHVAVVDPGVGGARAILAARGREMTFLAPDNGLLDFVLPRAAVEEMVSVENRRCFLPELSRTFHGRDIFAPVAARLALGYPLRKLGPAVREYRRADLRPAHHRKTSKGEWLVGEIVDVDKFGNCITNIPAAGPSGDLGEIRAGRWRFKTMASSYTDVGPGKPLAIVGSQGWVEISVNQGRADRLPGLARGGRVTARVK